MNIYKNKGIIFILTSIMLLFTVSGTWVQAGATAQKEDLPQIRIVPSASHVKVGETFEVAIWLQGFIREYSEMEGYEVHIDFDPAFIKPVTGTDKITPHSVFPAALNPMTLLNTIDAKGKIKIAQALTQRNHGLFSGYGKVGTVTFEAIKAGEATLTQEKSIVIKPGNPGINIIHTINHPTITIGNEESSDSSNLKEKIEMIGSGPKNTDSIRTASTVLHAFKDYQEISRMDWAKEAISQLALDRVIQGTSEGKFEPKRNMTRAEFAKVAVIALGLDMTQQQKPTFADIKKTDWFYDYVETAAHYGLVQGSIEQGEKVYLPQDTITRAEISAIMSRVLTQLKGLQISGTGSHPFKDIRADHWALKDVNLLFQIGLMNGRAADRFAPNEHATRAEVSVLLMRLLEFNPAN